MSNYFKGRLESEDIAYVYVKETKDVGSNSYGCSSYKQILTPTAKNTIVYTLDGSYHQPLAIIILSFFQPAIYEEVTKAIPEKAIFDKRTVDKVTFAEEDSKGEDKVPNHCTCNHTRTNQFGHSITLGCISQSGICKFYQKPIENGKCGWKLNESGSKILPNPLEGLFNTMASKISKKLQFLFPRIHTIMTQHSTAARECRLGDISRAANMCFSAVTITRNYSAHPHKDINNKVGGVTVICSFNKPGSTTKQYHILPKYLSPDLPIIGYSQEVLHFNGTTETISNNHLAAESKGGFGMFLPTGSILIEKSKELDHATSKSQSMPSVQEPNRLSLVFFQADLMDHPLHGQAKFGPNAHWSAQNITKALDKRANHFIKPLSQCADDAGRVQDLKKEQKFKNRIKYWDDNPKPQGTSRVPKKDADADFYQKFFE